MLSEIEFKIDGQNVKPATVRARDLLALLTKLESALAATAKWNGASEEELHISLVDVRDGSDRLIFAADDTMTAAAKTVSDAINQEDGSLLPPQAVFSLLDMHKAATKRAWSLGLHNGTFAATMEPGKEVFRTAVFKGQTTLFAQLTSVGGRKPTAHLILNNFQKLTAEVRSISLAKELGRHLYRNVTLIGEACWSAKDMRLRRFRIEELGDFEDDEADPLEAFEFLRKAVGDKWEGVDPDEYISDLRKD